MRCAFDRVQGDTLGVAAFECFTVGGRGGLIVFALNHQHRAVTSGPPHVNRLCVDRFCERCGPRSPPDHGVGSLFEVRTSKRSNPLIHRAVLIDGERHRYEEGFGGAGQTARRTEHDPSDKVRAQRCSHAHDPVTERMPQHHRRRSAQVSDDCDHIAGEVGEGVVAKRQVRARVASRLHQHHSNVGACNQLVRKLHQVIDRAVPTGDAHHIAAARTNQVETHLTSQPRHRSNLVQLDHTANTRCRPRPLETWPVSVACMSESQPDLFDFDNTFVRDLDGLFDPWQARQASAPRLLVLNERLAASLGVDPADLRTPEGVDVLVGNVVPAGAKPVAQAYAGHQFGGFSPRLGDGRALLLGEVVGAEGQRHDLHLKGSGRTRFARGGDGLAAVGPMLREHLMSEAMHALGVASTRGLAVVATGDDVVRETMLPGAVFVRVASSHLRVGTFQYAAAQEDPELVRRLSDYAIDRHHPSARDAPNPYLGLLDAVIDVQASLIAQWMLLGFIHGVMNTDNVTISGESIDYGPCAFMDAHDPSTVFSSIDQGGRYAYGNQPQVGQWNLARLAEPLLPLIDADLDAAVESATALLHTYPERYQQFFDAGLQAKLGLVGVPSDGSLFEDLFALLALQGADHTMFFRSLSAAVRGDESSVRSLVSDESALEEWLVRWTAARADEGRSEIDVAEAMDMVNPVYVPRNHLVEQALAAGSAGEMEPFDTLMRVLAEPFNERLGLERFAAPAPADFASGYQTFCGT
jgi:uncharacterized protein YdiU (UPF0061 family)